MTEAINYFQSLFNYQSISTTNLSKSEIRLAQALAKEARNLVKVADCEANSGKTSADLAASEKDNVLSQKLAQISLWHHQRAAKKYREAANQYEQAAKIWQQPKRQKLLRTETKQLREKAERAEKAVNSLTNFLKQN
jgi:hypothetical protein